MPRAVGLCEAGRQDQGLEDPRSTASSDVCLRSLRDAVSPASARQHFELSVPPRGGISGSGRNQLPLRRQGGKGTGKALERAPETRDAEMGKDVLSLGCLFMRLIKIYLPGRVWGKNDVMQIKYLPA